MPYLNLDMNYHEHPKTRRLIALLGPEGDIFPIRLWAYCGKIHPRDGALIGYTVQEIEGLIKWTGEPGKAVEALKKVGFISELKEGVICHDWKEHEGHLISFSRRAKKANKKRWSSILQGSLKHPSRVLLPNHTIPTIPAKEEKPYKPETPIQKVVCCYKLAKNIAIDDRGWDQANFARAAKAAKNLIDAFGGDAKASADWMVSFGEKMDKLGRDWTLETAARWAWDEKGKRENGREYSKVGADDKIRTA